MITREQFCKALVDEIITDDWLHCPMAICAQKVGGLGKGHLYTEDAEDAFYKAAEALGTFPHLVEAFVSRFDHRYMRAQDDDPETVYKAALDTFDEIWSV